LQRLLAEVGLHRVGLILGVEMARRARWCTAWAHLREIWARCGTVRAALDGIDDPR
jgi:hypothetical protein